MRDVPILFQGAGDGRSRPALAQQLAGMPALALAWVRHLAQPLPPLARGQVPAGQQRLHIVLHHPSPSLVHVGETILHHPCESHLCFGLETVGGRRCIFLTWQRFPLP